MTLDQKITSLKELFKLQEDTQIKLDGINLQIAELIGDTPTKKTALAKKAIPKKEEKPKKRGRKPGQKYAPRKGSERKKLAKPQKYVCEDCGYEFESTDLLLDTSCNSCGSIKIFKI